MEFEKQAKMGHIQLTAMGRGMSHQEGSAANQSGVGAKVTSAEAGKPDNDPMMLLGKSAFQPSFQNPAVWTDELMRQRQLEFAAFQRSSVGISEDHAFEAAYSEYENRLENGKPGAQTQRQIGLNTRGRGLSAMATAMDAFLGYCKVDAGGVDVNTTIGNTQWKSSYFDQFLQEMVASGCTNDGGAGCGQYGVPWFHKGRVALIAKCYPPADEQDLAGLSKIMVCGLVAGGKKEESFYFDSAQSFQIAIGDSKAYLGVRLAEARETIDQLHAVGMDAAGPRGSRPAGVSTVREGLFSGSVVAVSDDGIITQKVSRSGATVFHEAASLTKSVQVGDVIDIQYALGRGIVSGGATLARGR